MAASLTEVLARQLGLSQEQAEQRLHAFVAELKEETERDGHAIVPGLGTFLRAEDGLAFEQSEALGRAVNHEFATLEPVGFDAMPASSPKDAGAAPAPETEEAPAEEAPAEEAPAEEAPAEEAPAEEAPAEEAPAEEAPAEETPAGEAERPEPETPESQTPEAGEPAPEEPAPEEPAPPSIFDRSDSDLEGTPAEDVPAQDSAFGTPAAHENALDADRFSGEEDEAERAPDSSEDLTFSWNRPSETPEPEEPDTADSGWGPLPAEEAPERAGPRWNYAALPAGYLLHRRPAPDPAALRGAALHAPDSDAAAERAPADSTPEPHAEDRAPEDRAPEDRAPEDRAPEDRPAREPASQTRQSGSALRWVGGLLLLLVLALGVWYVLGQQGSVTGPLATLQQSQAAPERPGNDAAERPADAASDDQEAAADADAGAAGAAAEESPDAGSAARGAGEESEPADAWAQASRLDRAAGGWTIVVASETSRAEAEATAQTFAQRFRDRAYPIDILDASSDDGTTRHRVAVGQFASREEVLSALEDGDAGLPGDAWALQIPSGE